MRESDVEKKLVQGVKKLGGIAYKFVSPGNVGVPDRIVVLPGGKVVFVELKTDAGRLSKVQGVQIAKIQERGASVYVLYGEEQVEGFLQWLAKEV